MELSFRVLSTVFFLSSLCAAANVQDHVVGVERRTVHLSIPLRFQEVEGNGICIDERCSVVATAYHIQMALGRANLGVVGRRTTKVLSLANDSDSNKTDVPAGKKTLSYNIANDVSFVYTKKPVHHKSGVPYSYQFYVGQKVEVAGYYENKFETTEAHIIGANVPLIMGKAQLQENLVLDINLKPGRSGSAVLDQRGNLLGMIILTGAIKSKTGDLTASVALPVRTIARALLRLDPCLGSVVFNDIPEEEPRPLEASFVVYQDNDLPDGTSPVIPELSAGPSDVPDPVGKLRAKAEAAANLMVNFIAKQCLVQGTQKPLCHELSSVEGQQTYRELKRKDKLGKPTTFFPIQKHGIWTQADWLDTLGEIAGNSWIFQGVVNGHYLFSFKSAVEDDRCYYEEYSQGGIPLFGGGRPVWKGSVACFEQILTDTDFNVLSVFTEMRPPEDCLTQFLQTVIYYDWTKLEGIKAPILLPIRERITAKVQGQKDLWYSNVTWTEYKEFRASHRIKM